MCFYAFFILYNNPYSFVICGFFYQLTPLRLPLGSISAELVRRFGFRVVSMTGGLLSCLSFVAASFSTNIVVFILTYGLLAGTFFYVFICEKID